MTILKVNNHFAKVKENPYNVTGRSKLKYLKGMTFWIELKFVNGQTFLCNNHDLELTI